MRVIDQVWDWCKQSATIVWARLQSAIGLVLAAAASIDVTPLAGMAPRDALKMGGWLLASGVITEVARRRTLEK